jgi:hypothetical protein
MVYNESNRKTRLRAELKKAVLYALTEDLDGGELILKEVWEQCEGGKECDYVKEQLAILIGLVEKF